MGNKQITLSDEQLQALTRQSSDNSAADRIRNAYKQQVEYKKQLYEQEKRQARELGHYEEEQARRCHQARMEYKKAEAERAKRTADAIATYERNAYMKSSLAEKTQRKRDDAERLKRELDLLAATGSAYSDYEQKKAVLQNKYNEAKRAEYNLQNAINKAEFNNVPIKQKIALLEQRSKEYNEAITKAKIQRDVNLKNAQTDDERKMVKAQYAEAVSDAQNQYGMGNVLNRFGVKFLGKGSPLATAIGTLSSTFKSITTSASEGVDAAMDSITKYMGSLDARLQGSEYSRTGDGGAYQNIMSYVFGSEENPSAFTGSPYISQQKLIENVAKLTESGIAYNLEERAFLETLSDKMVTTFDTLDTTLTRLIRVQQADVSIAQMGSEAILTQKFNAWFKDTSYLTDMYDSVASAVLDASSQLSAENAVSFNYAVQKWLGSLYEVGMSSEGVSTLASGLNMLATGNVDELNSNSALQTLFAMSAKNAGLDYSAILTNGLNAETTNSLLESVVTYLHNIYANTANNQVVRNAWSNILNMSTSDLRAAYNLNQSDINNISGSTVNYSSATSQIKTTQLGKVASRTSPSEKIENVLSNLMMNFGNSMINSTSAFDTTSGFLKTGLEYIDETFGTSLQSSIGSWFNSMTGTVSNYYAWKLGSMVSDLGGTAGSVLGGALQLLASWDTIIPLMQSTMSNIQNGFSFDSVFDNFQEYQSRGTGFTGVTGNGVVLSDTSSSLVVGNASDATNTLTGNAEATTRAYNTISSSSASITRTASDLYYQLFDKRTTVRVSLANIEAKAMSDLMENMDEQFTETFKVEDSLKAAQDTANMLTSGTISVNTDIFTASDLIDKVKSWF